MWLPWSISAGQLMCTPWEYAIEPCLLNGVGLLPWEWDHFRQQQLGNAQHGNHSFDEHTLHAVHAEGNSGSAKVQTGFNLTEQVVEIDSKEAVEEAAAFTGKPLVLLDSLVHIDMGLANQKQQNSFDRLQQECRVLNTTEMLTKYDDINWSLLAGRLPELYDKLHVALRLRSGKLHRRRHSNSVQHNAE